MKFDKPLVCVTWNDAHGSALSSYHEHEIPHEPILIDTIGLLLRDDEQGVSVAGEKCGDGTYRSLTFVPRGMIVSMLWIDKPRVRKSKVKDVQEQREGEGL